MAPGGAPGGILGGALSMAPGGAPSGVPGGASAGPPAQPTSAPPATTAPSPEPSPVQVDKESVWVSLSGEVTEKPHAEVQTMILSGIPPFKIMSKDQSSGWVTPDMLGFALPAPVAPAAPVDNTPPPAAPSPEVAPAPETPAVEAPPADAAAPPSGHTDDGPISAEELAFVKKTQEDIVSAKDEVTGQILARFTPLNQRAAAHNQL